MLIKVHKAYRLVVGVCDKEILGRHFEHENKILDIKENFFNGEEKKEKEMIEMIEDLAKEDATFFIAGKKSIDCALKARVISRSGIKTIENVPFALVLI